MGIVCSHLFADAGKRTCLGKFPRAIGSENLANKGPHEKAGENLRGPRWALGR